MNIDNPNKIKKAEIIIGIPSYNEAETIGFVVEQVSQGLEKYFPKRGVVIINLDHNSPDGTRNAFFAAKSNLPRIYISTPEGVKGKGHNFNNLFRIFQDLRAEAGAVFDADLSSIRPNWVKKMINPILDGYGFVAPYYIRYKTDATITNHLVYPLVYGLYCWDVRQPIGGDFSFSDKMVDYWLKQEWRPTTYQFGIDVFMSLGAFLSGIKTTQVNLGSKVHNLSNPKLGQMFFQVAETLFDIILDNLDKIKQRKQVEKIEVLGGRKLPILANTQSNGELFRDIFWENIGEHWDLIKGIVSRPIKNKLSKIIEQKQGEIVLSLWSKIVYDFLLAYQKSSNKAGLIEALGCLYFGRVACFFRENGSLTPEQAEKEVKRRVKYFYKQRNYFLDKL